MAPTQQQIYARRRGLAILALLIAALTVWGFSSFGSGQNAEPTPIPTVDETATAAPSEIVDCQPGAVVIEARIGDTDGPKASFSSGEKPMIWYEISNVGAVDCKFNVGPRVTFFTITSGDETYWSSKDCDRENLKDLVTVLKANSTVPSDRTAAIWERVRSSGEGCGADQQPVPGGGASYFLKVEVNGVYSENSVQFLLN